MRESPQGLIDYLLTHRDELIEHLRTRLESAELAAQTVGDTLALLRARQMPTRVADPGAYLFAMATHLGIDRLLRQRAQVNLRRQMNDCNDAMEGTSR